MKVFLGASLPNCRGFEDIDILPTLDQTLSSMGGRLIILSTEFIQEIVFASVLWGLSGIRV